MLRSDENGFTLIEVLVAALIFSLGVLAVINMQYFSTATNLKSRRITEAVVVAQGKVEELVGVDYASLVDDNGNQITNKLVTVDPSLDDVGNNADYSDPANAGSLYQIFWNVREDYPFDETKMVRVIVQWDERGLTNTYSLDMIKTDGE